MMKKLIIILILGLIFGVAFFSECNSQTWVDSLELAPSGLFGITYSPIAEFDHKISAKIVKKRFYYAGIWKDIIIDSGKYYIELEPDDHAEYFDFTIFRKKIFKIWCLPKRLRGELEIYSIDLIY